MKFIEMTGGKLSEIINDEELHATDLKSAGIHDGSIIRVNEHGDIEVRRTEGWDVIGGLIGEFTARVREKTGLDFA